MSVSVNEYKGYSLFKDVIDAEMRHFNQSRVILNMIERSVRKDGTMETEGAQTVLRYFSLLPTQDRRIVLESVSSALRNTKEGVALKGVFQ